MNKLMIRLMIMKMVLEDKVYIITNSGEIEKSAKQYLWRQAK